MSRYAFIFALLVSSMAFVAFIGCGHMDDSSLEREPMYWISAIHITGRGLPEDRHGSYVDAVCIEGEADQVCATEVIVEHTTATNPERALGRPDGWCDVDEEQHGVAVNNARVNSGEGLRVGFGREIPVYRGDKVLAYSSETDTYGLCPFMMRSIWLVDRDGKGVKVFGSNFRPYKVLDEPLVFETVDFEEK